MDKSEAARKLIQHIMDDGKVSRADVGLELDMTRQGVAKFMNGNHDMLIRYAKICKLAGYEIIFRKDFVDVNVSKAILEEK